MIENTDKKLLSPFAKRNPLEINNYNPYIMDDASTLQQNTLIRKYKNYPSKPVVV
jgi:hypothetical protein